MEWFDNNEVGPQKHSVWAQYYVQTVDHKGLHCVSCLEDQEWGYMDYDDEFCCCKAYKEESNAGPSGD